MGVKHVSVALSLSNIALLYESQGQFDKAKPLLQRAYTIYEKALGPEHSSTALSLNSLAFLFNKQGFHAKAEPLTRKGIGIEFSLVQRNAWGCPGFVDRSIGVTP